MSQDILCCVGSVNAGGATAPVPELRPSSSSPGTSSAPCPRTLQDLASSFVTQDSCSSCPKTSGSSCPRMS
eukprot:15466079-Alexandrium_andersonii.AAC.1